MKDYFSQRSESYAKYRPVYPTELYQYILSYVTEKNLAWDCGTGNGQTAAALSPYFSKVWATDISQQQLNHAVKLPNVSYSLEPAEHASLQDNSVNLICISQALHWFNFTQFYKEVKRVAAPRAVIAAWSYNLFNADNFTNAITEAFYRDTLKNYWDVERQYVDDGYKNIPFPFENIESPAFAIQVKWTLDELTGYLETWSAVQKFITENNYNPVPHIADKLKKRWPANEKRKILFPLKLKLAYIH